MNIRLATPNDAQQLLEIYAPYVLDSTFTFEYDVPTRQKFAQRIATTLATHPYLVAETDGLIQGYAYAHPLNERPAYQWSAEISVYVAANTKGQGIGKQLYLAIEEILKAQHVGQIIAAITANNHHSVAFHEHMGYRLVGTLANVGFKQGQWLDVVWLQKNLTPTTNQPLPFVPFPDLNV